MKQYSHYSHCFFAKDGAEGACIRGATEGRRGGAKMLSKPYQARRPYAGHCHTHTNLYANMYTPCMPQWYIIWVCHRCWNNTTKIHKCSICMCADLSLLTTKSGSRVWALFWVDSGSQGKLIGYNEAMDQTNIHVKGIWLPDICFYITSDRSTIQWIQCLFVKHVANTAALCDAFGTVGPQHSWHCVFIVFVISWPHGSLGVSNEHVETIIA